MTASDHLNPQLFHGTTTWLAPGEVIHPGSGDYVYERGYNYGHTPKEHMTRGAYATTNEDTAEHFARVKGWDEFHNSDSPHQLSLLHPVYEVEHVSEHSDPLHRLLKDERRDLVGFRVRKLHKYVPSAHMYPEGYEY